MKLRITAKEVKEVAKWGMTGVGSFLVFEPIQGVIVSMVDNPASNLMVLITEMFQANFKLMGIGVVILVGAMYLFKLN